MVFYGLPLEREASFICLISGDHCVASRKGLHAAMVSFLSLHHKLLKKFNTQLLDKLLFDTG